MTVAASAGQWTTRDRGGHGFSVACTPADCHHATVTSDPLLERAQRLWADLAGAPVAFTESAIEVVASPRSLLCPPGWVGIVALGRAAIATAPDDGTAEIVQHALNDLPATTVIDPAAVRDRLPVQDTLGPATLAYCDAAGFRPAESGAVETISANHTGMAALLARVPAEDAGESGLAEITSPAFVVRAGTDVIAAAGYRGWPGHTAHISVLTAPAARGRGLGRVVATAAVTHALNAGLLPQWRARPEASRRVARALGFYELGSQLSINLTPADSTAQ
ncbi:GNAT family N-acetyltransferase [Dactylosporangium sp. NPDC051485]|uniref:GNAT family N-acetyltransferase n=1 Tax=Dactylosporangium sp. NPDC051485 TaxID=3154846 RepID=UPI00342ABA76